MAELWQDGTEPPRNRLGTARIRQHRTVSEIFPHFSGWYPQYINHPDSNESDPGQPLRSGREYMVTVRCGGSAERDGAVRCGSAERDGAERDGAVRCGGEAAVR